MDPSTDQYLTAIQKRLGRLHSDEAESIAKASRWCAEVIAARGVIHVFGAGHSRMAAEEAYPRIGAVVGFRPVVELAVTYFHEVVGQNGLDQALFLERVPGYGRVVFESLRARKGDAVLVFSSSGLENIILDLVDAAQEMGNPVIGVTSAEYSKAAAASRGVERRLADVADLVIDNHVPVGDALVEIDGLRERVAASASILNLAVMGSITAGTAEELVRLGRDPYVFASPHLVGEDESARRYEECIGAYEQLVQRRRDPSEDSNHG